jgi:hypothetical protein
MSEENDEQGQEDPANLRQALKDQGKVNSDLREENEKLLREMTFRDAGIPDEGAGKYFRKAYEGDLNAEEIRTAALADGIISDKAETPPPEPQPTVPRDELDAMNRINGGDEGSGGEDSGDLEARFRDAKSENEIMEIARQAGLAEPR